MKVLFICHGNICRSPTAEGVFRDLLAREAPQLGIDVDSAGTSSYHTGEPPDPRSQRHALERGIDLSALRARQVEPRDYRDCDLMLAMDRENLRALSARRPRDAKATTQLFLAYAPQTGMEEVPDPYYGDARDFELVLDLVFAASRGLLDALQQRA